VTHNYTFEAVKTSSLTTLACRALLVLSFVAATLAPVAAQQQPPQPPPGFVSVDELPPEEQVPAAPLLIGAYVFVVLALFGYVISVGRRLGGVQRDIERLEGTVKKGSRA
jgi:hypothetical protein